MTRALAVLVLFATAATADDKPNPASPAEKLEALKKEQKKAEDAYRKAVELLPDTPDGEKKSAELWKAYDKGQAARFMDAVILAQANPESDVAFSAVEWVLTIPRSYYLPAGIPAMRLVTEYHAANPKVGKIVAWVGYYTPSEQFNPDEYTAAMALIKAVAEKNPDRTARGQAVMALAQQAQGRFAVAEYKRSPDAEKLAAEAEQAFERVVKDYADCPRLVRDGKETLGDRARRDLFELRHLRVGKVAPDIEGEDLDGKKFKLSDSRGKITLVVFWATWCGPCMEMVPQEKKLVERYKDKPFVIVGVNGDGDRAAARTTAAKEGITWRSFWNGPEDGDGPITKAWNVYSWPMVYVLDGKGVIRFKGLQGADLDMAVDQLLTEADK